jgi:hypothetical protein
LEANVKDTEVSTAEKLDAPLALGGVRKHARLWQVAEGHFGWSEAVGLLTAVLLVAFGLLEYGRSVGVAEFMRGGIAFIASGLLLLISFQWSAAQRQRSALLELLRHLEKGHS